MYKARASGAAMLSDAVKELANQLAVLLVTLWLHDSVSVPAITYCANVLFVVFVLAPSGEKSVRACNCCLLHTTLRVSCSLFLYGVLALFNRDPGLQ